MKVKKIKSLIALALALVLCLGLIGCGKQPAEEGGNTQTSDLSNTLVYAGENESSINPVILGPYEI